MLLPLHFQLDLWRRWPADFDDVPDGKGALDRNPLGICTRCSDLADDLYWRACLLTRALSRENKPEEKVSAEPDRV